MPTCNQCNSPCNCSIDEDGVWANRPQDGRRNVNVAGSGTIQDPITISFMQSEFFRPEASEIQSSSKSINSGTATEVQSDDYDIVVYQTPNQVFVKAVGLAPFDPMTAINNFWVVGASATFSANATGERAINILTEDDTTGSLRIAGNRQTAISSSSSTLSCAGFASGFFNLPPVFEGIFNKKTTIIDVYVYQSSGAPMNVTQIKLWTVMI